jgi:hypothetical protein
MSFGSSKKLSEVILRVLPFSFLNEKASFGLFRENLEITNDTIGIEVTTSAIGREKRIESKLSDEIPAS